MRTRTEAALLAGVFLTGIATAILGSALPMLQLRYGVSIAELGRLFVAQFAGSALAATASQRNPRFSLIAGFQLIAVGVAATALAPWRFATISVFVYGVGLGFAIPAANMTIAFARQSTRGASLNILNLAWGVGAAATPLLLLAVVTQYSLSIVYLGLAAASELCAIALVILLESAAPIASAANTTSAFDSGIALHALRFLLYVGSESCIGGWTAEYVAHTFHVQRSATLCIAAFWIALLAGRAAAPALLRRHSEFITLRISMVVALAGVGMLFAAQNVPIAAFGALVAGAGMATVFGLQLSAATTYAESRGMRIPGWLFTCASIGGVSMPWLFGEIAQRTSSLRVGLLLPFTALAVLVLLTLCDRPTSAA